MSDLDTKHVNPNLTGHMLGSFSPPGRVATDEKPSLLLSQLFMVMKHLVPLTQQKTFLTPAQEELATLKFKEFDTKYGSRCYLDKKQLIEVGNLLIL